jgi:hypothetical protein
MNGMLTAIKCTGTSIDTVLIEASLPQLLIGELNLFGDDLDLGHIPDNGPTISAGVDLRAAQNLRRISSGYREIGVSFCGSLRATRLRVLEASVTGLEPSKPYGAS